MAPDSGSISLTPENFKLFQQQLREALSDLFEDLSRVKGFSLRSVWRVMIFLLTAGPNVIPLWAMASPDERKRAVVISVNEVIDIPFVGESFEAAVIGQVYDIIFARLGLG